MHGIMSIAQLGMDQLRAASRILVHGQTNIKSGIRTTAVNSTSLIPIMGVLMRREGTFQPYVTDIDEARDAITAAANDPKVREIVMVIDSPGGSVEGLHELGQSVASAAKSKTVVAQVQGMAASAAYYIASQATEIVSGPMDVIGSIGTILVVQDWSKLFEEVGVRVVPIATGPFKATGTMGTPLTADQEAYLQGIVDAYFADFKATIKRGRKMSAEDVDAVADGKVFMAKQALKLGLIDRIGTIENTIGGFAEKSRIRAQKSMIDVLSMRAA